MARSLAMLALLAALGFLALGPARSAGADEAAAAAQMPDPPTPFLHVQMEAPDDFSRPTHLPEYVVYGDGTFLVQKNDQRLWVGRLTREQTLGLLAFVLDDARLPRVSMTYIPPLPMSTWREYRVTTKSGTTTVRRRLSGISAGPGVADGERSAQRTDDRVYAFADLAGRPYERPRLRVVSRRVTAPAAPVWTLGEAVPFAAFGDATDASHAGALVEEAESALFSRAFAQSRTWRFGTEAREFRARFEMPEEARIGGWRAAPLPEPARPAPPPEGTGRPDPGTPPAPTPTSPEPAADDLDFAGVQKIFEDLKRKATGSPHGSFWKKPYAEFVAYEFKTADGDVVRLVKLGDGPGSNLVRGLRGEPLEAVTPEGKSKTIEGKVMPPKGAPMPEADILRISRWVDRGCPEARAAGAPVPGAAPLAKTIALEAVGRGAVVLGPTAKADEAATGPTMYVAADEAGWKALFDSWLRERGGDHGAAVADGLRDLRDSVKGYDFAASPLILIVGPPATVDFVEVGPSIEITVDGTGRLTASPRRGPRPVVEAQPPPPVRVHWTLWRAVSKPPATLSLRWSP